MEAAVKALWEGRDLSGQGGILTPLLKQLSEAAMQAELEDHLLSEDQSNRKNGLKPKVMQSSAGEFEMNIQRDRSGRFEPQIFKKHQTHLTNELEVSFEGASKGQPLCSCWQFQERLSL
jgi:putative transposase